MSLPNDFFLCCFVYNLSMNNIQTDGTEYKVWKIIKIPWRINFFYNHQISQISTCFRPAKNPKKEFPNRDEFRYFRYFLVFPKTKSNFAILFYLFFILFIFENFHLMLTHSRSLIDIFRNIFLSQFSNEKRIEIIRFQI